MPQNNIKIFENESANGQYPSAGLGVPFKQGLLAVYGTWGTATAKLQMKAPGSGWEDVRDTSGAVVTWTADAVDVHLPYIPSGYMVRGDISGVTGGESLSMEITN